jgi:hypothetical protein
LESLLEIHKNIERKKIDNGDSAMTFLKDCEPKASGISTMLHEMRMKTSIYGHCSSHQKGI